MLVVVALLVLMMTIIVSIFGAATGAVSVAKVYQGLDDELRQIDSVIRQDLQGATARFNPPLDPSENRGYFEYIENAPADSQGEDSDDCIKFTTQAPPGQPFTGRFYVPTSTTGMTNVQLALFYNSQPITITSDYAEIIYFLRHGNLYRRVLLIVPEKQQIVTAGGVIPSFPTRMFGNLSTISWQGANDISAPPRGPVRSSARPCRPF